MIQIRVETLAIFEKKVNCFLQASVARNCPVTIGDKILLRRLTVTALTNEHISSVSVREDHNPKSTVAEGLHGHPDLFSSLLTCFVRGRGEFLRSKGPSI